MKRIIVWIALLFEMTHVYSQKEDTLLIKEISNVLIQGYRFETGAVRHLDAVHQTYITSGKKNEVLTVQDLPANLTEKTGRQIFAKKPGTFVYDMDGSGNQINVSTRGLDPHRSWEYNVRQNNIMTNSDMYGYPASHYSPPLESITKIEMMSGTSSLQYGSQFGGMINYVTKQGDTSKPISYESLSSIGSYGLLSTFQSIGGKSGRFRYYAYYQRRNTKGYRDGSRSDAQAQFFNLSYAASPDLQIKAELGRSQYLYQIPGPLSDAMFKDDPRQSSRRRNYFSPDIYVPSVTVDWKISPSTRLNWVSSAVLGTRNSVQFIGLADVEDKIDPLTGQYKPRQVDIDNFNSYSNELRLQQHYHLGKIGGVLVGGLRFVNNDLHRRQQGKGTTGTDYSLEISEANFGRDIHYKTDNVALFAENLFQLTPRLQLSAGFRVESGTSKMRGIISYLPDEIVPQDIDHRFPLFGISGQYRLKSNHLIYGGWSQAYRPVIFADIIPATVLDRSDPDLKDAYGHNAELGIKGHLGTGLKYDLSLFRIYYKNRIGTHVLSDGAGETYFLKTNIGDSRTHGVEAFAELNLVEQPTHRLSVFTASSYFDAIYLNGKLRDGSENKSLEGNRLETVPEWISRNGIQFNYKLFTAVFQHSYVAEIFSDAVNTVQPSANGAKGKVPAYTILDLNMSYRFNAHYLLKFGINNLANRQYFTKRPAGYPGQGVWSSDGRSLVVSFGIRL